MNEAFVALSSVVFRIVYEDGEGEITERLISLKRIEERPLATYLIGFCQLAKAARAFRTDRIQSLTDMRTGEIVDGDVTNWIRAMHNDLFDSAPSARPSVGRRKDIRRLIDDPKEIVEGWKFGAPMPAFAKCFDYALTPRVEPISDARGRKILGDDGKPKKHTVLRWTEGIPPKLDFAQGEVFYSPAATRALAWGDDTSKVVIQIESRDNDRVSIIIFHMPDGEITAKESRIVTQNRLVEILRHGL